MNGEISDCLMVVRCIIFEKSVVNASSALGSRRSKVYKPRLGGGAADQ